MALRAVIRTSLGYEPYDARLCCFGQSLAVAVTSADRTGHISLGRLGLPLPALSRRVRFTNRFTEQAIDLQFPALFPLAAARKPNGISSSGHSGPDPFMLDQGT